MLDFLADRLERIRDIAIDMKTICDTNGIRIHLLNKRVIVLGQIHDTGGRSVFNKG